jgi:hypothetical protein
MEKFQMFEELDWPHQEAFHLGYLCASHDLDYIMQDHCIIINGYTITNDLELASFASALKIIADKNVFLGDDNGTA